MGTHMTELLIERGYDVCATDIGPTSAHTPAAGRAQRCEYKQCDLRDRSQAAALFAGRAFDYVFHIAGLFDYSAAYKDLFEVNVLGSLNLINAATASAFRPKRMVVWG